MTPRTQASLLFSALLVACGESPRAEEPDADASRERDAGEGADGAVPAADAAAMPDASDADARAPSVRPQPNVSFETAARIEPDAMPWLQDERSVDQVDYYVFAGAAGAFYEISTDSGMFMPDNLVSVYDDEHTLIARNDEGTAFTPDPIDARLIVRLPADGDYFVVVEDPWTPHVFFESGFPLLFYHLRVHELTDDTPGVAIARDGTPAEVTFVEDSQTGYAYATLLGVIDDEPRTFDFDGREANVLVARALAADETGFGSGARKGEITVLDDDMHVLSRVDRALGQDAFHPPIGAAPHHLTLGAVDAAGDNAFHAIDLVLLPDNPVEKDDAANDEPAGAEPIALEGGTYRRGLVLMRLPAGDIDHFQLEVEDGDSVSVRCEAESGGSGVRGLTAELLDGDEVIGAALETPEENLFIDSIPIATARTLQVRVSADGASIDPGVEPWARCSIDIGP